MLLINLTHHATPSNSFDTFDAIRQLRHSFYPHTPFAYNMTLLSKKLTSSFPSLKRIPQLYLETDLLAVSKHKGVSF